MVTKVLYLDLQDPGIIHRIPVSRYDSGLRAFEFHLLDNGLPYQIPTGSSITIQGTKPDKNGFTYSCTYDATTGVVTANCTEQMTAVLGDVKTQLVVVDTNQKRVATFLFFICVHQSAVTDGTVFSDSELAYAEQVINNLQSIDAYAVALNNLSSSVTTISNTVEAQKYYITPQMYGAVGDGVTDDINALTSWLADIATNNKRGYVPSGTYLISSQLKNTSVSNDVHIEFGPNAAIKAAEGYPSGQKLFALFDVEDGVDKKVYISGATFISVNVPASATGQANDCLSIGGSCMNSVVVERCKFVNDMAALSSWTYTPAVKQACDSGFMAVCSNLVVRDCQFYGYPDCGIYVSGGSAGSQTAEYRHGVIDKCSFYGCSAAVNFKRLYNDCVVTNSYFTTCGTAIAASEADNIEAAQRVIATNNVIVDTELGVALRKCVGGIVSNNIFKRMGFSTTTYPICVSLQGMSNVSVTGNTADLEGTFAGWASFLWAIARDSVPTKDVMISGNTVIASTSKTNDRGFVTDETSSIYGTGNIFKGIDVALGTWNSASKCHYTGDYIDTTTNTKVNVVDGVVQ